MSAASLESSSSVATDKESLPFVGRWHKLVSTTNWEKGKIISEWRDAKKKAGEEVSAYSDEAWAQMVGEVTSQHVGRLRRVFDRFGPTYNEYEGLYWSHFHTALDWEDAEIWLEGALQGKWSVSQMRRQHDAAHSESGDGSDDNVVEAKVGRGESETPTGDGDVAEVHDPDASDEDTESGEAAPASGAPSEGELPSAGKTTKARVMADLPQLPDDLTDAFEDFKLAILHHKLSGWKEVSCDDILISLDALKQLAEAPSE